jgi:PAS domain S-box-containing protein
MTNDDYKELFDCATIGLWRTTINGTFINVNSYVAHILGYDSINDLKQHNAAVLYDSDKREEFVEQLKQFGEISNFEIRMRKKDQTTIWVSISAKIYPEKGYIEGSIQDISSRKNMEESFIPHLQTISSLKETIIQRIQDGDNVFKNLSRSKSLKTV